MPTGFTYTIDQLLQDQLPAGFVLGTDYVAHRTMYWQNMLFTAAGIAEADAYDINNWPSDWVMLIGYMIIWDVFQKALTGKIMQASSMGLDGHLTSKGPTKKIVTGPIEAEYTDTTAAFAQLLRGIELSEGPFFEVFSNACALARSLKVKIPMCKGNFVWANIQKAKIIPDLLPPLPIDRGGDWDDSYIYYP